MVISAIAGTAGVGKTTLAVHWAHQVADRFRDGQLYINLRGYHPSGQAMAWTEAIRGFLSALEVPAGRIPSDLDAQIGLYRSLLAGRRMLVLLDNARDADQVRPLLPGSAGCLALVTGRNQLTGLIAAEGAKPLQVDLLTTDEARRLPATRLGADRVAAEPAATDEIIARCARLPLALAVAAARATLRPGAPLAMVAGQLREAGSTLDALDAGDPATDARLLNPHRETITPPQPGVAPERLTDDDHASAWIAAEYGNLLAAIGYAEANGFDGHVWRLGWTIMDFVHRRGIWHDWKTTQLAALAAARRLGDRPGQAAAHRNIATACSALGEYQQVWPHLRDALALYERLGDQLGMAHTHLNMSTLAPRGPQP